MKPWEKYAASGSGPWTKYAPPDEKPAPGPAPSEAYGAMDKAKYTLRAGSEGLLFGLGDVLAGVTNMQVAPLAKTVTAIKEGTPLSWADFNPMQNFKEGRGDFVREQDDFKQAHPGLNLTGEIVGGLASGVGGAAKAATAKTLGKLGKWGASAAAGAASGAGFGLGSGLTSNADGFDLKEGLKQGAQGAFLGGLFGVGVPAAFAGSGKLAHAFSKSNRTFHKVAKAAGEDLNRSIQTHTPLLDIGGQKVAKLGKTAKRADEKAGDLLDEYIERGFSEQGDKLHAVVNKYVPATGEETAESLTAAKRALSKDAYEPLESLGALSKINRGVAKAIISSPQIQQAIRLAKRNVPQLRKLPRSDFRVLNEAKKILDVQAQAGPLASSAEKTTARYARAARAQLIDAIDSATGGAYKDTLEKYGDLLGAERALNRGRELLNMPPRAAQAAYKRAGEAEKEALRIGLAQELQRRIRKNNIDGSVRNLARTLVGSEQNKKLFQAVLGKDADKFIDELSVINRAVKNYGFVKSGSDTAENLNRMSQSLGFLRRPVEAAVHLAGRGLDWMAGLNQEQIARMLIDPGYASIMRAKAGALPKSAYTNISGAGGVFAHIAGPLTRGENDVMRKAVKGELMQNVRNTSVYNSELGKDIRFNRVGIDKALGSASNTRKIEMLGAAPEVSKRGKKLAMQYSDDTIETLYTPVIRNGQKDVAMTTLESDKKGHPYFHNVNPFDYWIKKAASRTYPTLQGGNRKAATNSIPRKKRGVKPFSMKDFLILLSRPWTLGLEGNIAREKGETKAL